MVMSCILWFGGQMVVGDQVTVPSNGGPPLSLQTVVPLPPAGWPGAAKAGPMAKLVRARTAAPRYDFLKVNPPPRSRSRKCGKALQPLTEGIGNPPGNSLQT